MKKEKKEKPYKYRKYSLKRIFSSIRYNLKKIFIDVPKNRKLIKRFPFLDDSMLYKYYWSPDSDRYKEIEKEHKKHPLQRYYSTYLDHMPKAWADTFGIQLCEDLRTELIRCNFLDQYQVTQVKEKYGTLHWYDSGYPEGSRIHDIINYYEDYSMGICQFCGKPSEYVTRGWISYICGDCAKSQDMNPEYLHKLTTNSIPKRAIIDKNGTKDVFSGYKFPWPQATEEDIKRDEEEEF